MASEEFFVRYGSASELNGPYKGDKELKEAISKAFENDGRRFATVYTLTKVSAYRREVSMRAEEI
jgi:hypothetical protein